MEGKEGQKKEADRFKLVDGRFKQRNSHPRLVLGGCGMSRSLSLPARILRVRIEYLMGLSDIHSPDHLNHSLKAVSLQSAPIVVTMGRRYLPRMWEGVRTLQLPGSSLWVS